MAAPKSTAWRGMPSGVATHARDGGPIPATNQTTRTHYAYHLEMNDQGKATKLTKIWNDGFCLKELGWA